MTPAAASLWLEYLPSAQVAFREQAWRDSALGAICFGVGPAAAELPVATVDMLPLADGEGVCEVWHSRGPLRSGTRGAIQYRQGENVLFGILSRAEDDASAGGTGSPLQSGAELAYQEIFELLAAEGYGTVLRFWNYFPDINRETHGMERYRQFNVGRQDAFLAHGRSVIGNVPAACALGSASGALTIAFLAVRGDVVGIENPRQVSAYDYPSQYGPRSPTFARAGLLRAAEGDMLFISGTASIVGHRSLHEGDIVAQTRETMTNIAAVVTEANRRAAGAGLDLAGLSYKIYVRNPADMAAVQREVEAFVGAPVQAVYLRADICRSDLLVEIEASGGHPTHFQ